MASVDLNADLAEGYGVWELGDDTAMLDIVTSANLACGFHAGNPVGLARTRHAAAQRGVLGSAARRTAEGLGWDRIVGRFEGLLMAASSSPNPLSSVYSPIPTAA